MWNHTMPKIFDSFALKIVILVVLVLLNGYLIGTLLSHLFVGDFDFG